MSDKVFFKLDKTKPYSFEYDERNIGIVVSLFLGAIIAFVVLGAITFFAGMAVLATIMPAFSILFFLISLMLFGGTAVMYKKRQDYKKRIDNANKKLGLLLDKGMLTYAEITNVVSIRRRTKGRYSKTLYDTTISYSFLDQNGNTLSETVMNTYLVPTNHFVGENIMVLFADGQSTMMRTCFWVNE